MSRFMIDHREKLDRTTHEDPHPISTSQFHNMADQKLKSNDTSNHVIHTNLDKSDMPAAALNHPLLSPFITQDIDLKVLPEPLQLSHGGSEHISTQPFRKCSISTKITDLRRCWFKDERVGGEGKRDACVIVFELEFGEQVRDSGQRITEMGVWVLVEEVDGEDQTPSPQQSDTLPPITQVPNPDLAIKAIYPRSASGPLSTRTITTSVTTELTPTFNNISIFTSGVKREKSHIEPHWAHFTTSAAGTQGVKLSLTENALLKTGIPERLRFAVLLQTDGLPFDIELRFKGAAKSWGVKVGAKSVLRVGTKYLWYRRGEEGGGDGNGNGEVRFDEDADSERFESWIVQKTGNSWAEGVEWK
ncbi:hypothetical protein BKA64DRAFT_665909 [Cadophora sp. MPI-SDFR-AT-0126]|nr:hypothetical protein BKA64DRAFT_665909 [Leotiomycetes sp. MPI-SDFR-AT-0126]